MEIDGEVASIKSSSMKRIAAAKAELAKEDKESAEEGTESVEEEVEDEDEMADEEQEMSIEQIKKNKALPKIIEYIN